MTVRVFLSRDLQGNETVKRLVNSFKKYKAGEQPEGFGEDRDYRRPPNAKLAELRHIHLTEENTRRKTSDRFLVYCPAVDTPDTYLLIDILEPGHARSRNPATMARLVYIAEQFRNNF